jgi:DNA-directed RNA polymerase specialized sigma24 family protein
VTTEEQLTLADLEHLPDPAERAVAAHGLMHRFKAAGAEASRVRHEAVSALREAGWSHQQIADLLHVQKGTAQLIAEGRSSGRRSETQQRRNDDAGAG